LTWDLLRIIDFYYLFPSQLKRVQPWPVGLKKYKSSVADIPDQFEDIANPARVFFDLSEFQKTALLELISKGLVSKEAFEKGVIKLDSQKIPAGFTQAMNEDSFVHSSTFKVLIEALPKIDMNGSTGLKKRSGLMEFIYDVK